MRSVGRRLTLGVIAVFLVGSVSLALVVQGLMAVQARSSDRVELDQAIGEGTAIARNLSIQRGIQAEIALTADPTLVEEFNGTAEASFARLDTLVEQFAWIDGIEAQSATVAEIDERHDALVLDELVPAAENGSATTTDLLLQARTILTELLTEVSTLVDLIAAETESADAALKSAVAATRLRALIGGFAVLATALAVAWTLTRSITKPLSEVTAAAQRLAVGDVDIRIEHRSTDELGVLADSVRDAAGYLRSVSAVAAALADGDLTRDVEVRGSTDQLGLAVSSMVTGLRQTVHSLHAATDHMGSTTARLGEIVEGLASAAGTTTASAEEASQRGQELHADLRGIVTATQEVQRAVSTVTTRTGEARTTMEGLARSSREIAAVVTLITAISEQTNLLSLNATIEAARAGESGKGFAVVANEVRALAGQAAQAALKIQDMISAIESDTEGTGRSISTVATAVDEVLELAQRIGASVESGARSTQAITEGTGSVLEAASSTRAASRLLAGAETDLRTAATDLRNVVARFRV
jgi:methyl-accepting chemotaxis protein